MTPCDNCPIRKGCDWLSEMCRLTPLEVAKRRDLIKVSPPVPLAFAAENERQKGVVALGFKKYDKRRKPNTPQREL